MSDYTDSIKALETQSTSLDVSSNSHATASSADANEIRTLCEDPPTSTSIPDSPSEYDQAEQEIPDYLSKRKIRVRKYQLKK